MLSGEVPGTWLEQWAVTTHLLPTSVLLVAFVLAWRWPLVGAVVFGVFVIVAAIVIAPEWGYLLFALPHVVVAILSWPTGGSAAGQPWPSPPGNRRGPRAQQ